MAVPSSPVYEGDVIFLYCTEARGYVYADPPGSKFSRVTAFTPETSAPQQDPGFPNIHFAAFQILPSNAKPNAATLNAFKGQDAFTRSLVYGRKIKLLHMGSRKYLSFASPKDGGNDRSTAYLVDWKKEEEDECLLRVLPAQSGIRRQRGEDVLPGDTIRLECVTQTGHHILVMENAVTSRFEVKRAVTDSVFTIHMHVSGHEKIPRRAIRGAAVVFIHNLKHEVYLSGEGSIASGFLKDRAKSLQSKDNQEDESKQEKSDSVPPEDTDHASVTLDQDTTAADSPPTLSTTEAVHDGLLRKTGIAALDDLLATDISIPLSKEICAHKPRNIHGLQRISLCGDIFWQLEDFGHPLNGDWVQFEKRVRIKHIPSQRYLAVVYKDDKPDYLTLKEQDSALVSSPDFAFLLIQTEKREERLTKRSYVEIRHVHGEHVRSLMINTCRNFSRQTSTDESCDVTDLSVDQFDRIYGISLVDPNDTQLPKRQLLFKIEEVRQNFVQQFYHVLGVTGLLMSYAERCIADGTSSFLDDSKEAEEMAKMFSNWVRQSQHSQVRAEMLRIAKAVDVMMELIRLLDTEKQKKFLGFICTTLERFVLVGGKRCCFYLAKQRYINLLLEKVGCGIKAEEVLSALAKDEIKVTELLVSCLIDSQIMKNKLSKKLDAPALNLLSSLCFSEGRPVRRLQAIILKTIIEGGKTTLYRTKIDQEAHAVVISSPKRLAGTTLNALKPQPRNIVVAQVKLFSRVCKGVNKASIRKIVEEDKLVTIEEALMCVNDSELHPFLRSAYIDFILSTLVDVNVEESGTTVDNIWHTFDWEYLTFNPMKAVADVFDDIPNGKEIENLQKTMRSFLKECTPLKAKEEKEGTNEMIIQMLNAMEPLAAYGFYWNPAEVQSIIEVLISLISGSYEQFILNKEGQVQPKNEKNKMLYQLKTKAVNILHFFFEQFSYMALCKMVYDYGFLKGNEHCSDETEYIKPNSTLKKLTSCDCPMSPELTLEARKRLRYYLSEEGYTLFQDLRCTANPFIQSLVDLIQFEDDSLRVSSCKLLFTIFRAEKILFSKAESSYIYTSALYDTQDRMRNLAAFADDDKLLLLMIQGCAESGENLEKAMETLDVLAEDFIIDGKDTKPDTVNQNIALSSGLVRVLLEYVHYYCKEKDGKQAGLVAKTCFTLQRSARRNKKVQAKIFENYIDLLDAQVAPDAVAELLTEMFTDNEELCRKVSESELSLIFHTASTGDNHMELFTTLQAVTKSCKSAPVLMPRFQDSLARHFSESLHDDFSFLLVRGHMEHFPLDILRHSNPDTPKLVKLLNVCDLLSICSEGEKKFPEDVCQAIFSLEELIQILEDNTIPIERKKPFTSLINEAYVISDRESLTAVSTLAKAKGFWAHVDFAAQLMSYMSETIRSNFSVEPTEIQTLLHHLAHRHISLQTWSRLSAGLTATVTCGGQEILLANVLFYIMEGFLPMITAFCNQLSEENRADISSKLIRTLLTPQNISLLKAVGDGVVALAREKNIFVSSKPHVQLMSECLESLLFLVPSSEWSSFRDMRTTLLQWEVAKPPSLRSSGHSQTATQEVQENQSFKQFVENYHQAYTYTGKHNKADSVGGGEELIPVDTSFTALIRCFYQGGSSDEDAKHRVEKFTHLLNFLDVLYQQLQHPLANRERNSLDAILLNCLKLLGGILYFYITKKDITEGARCITQKEIAESEQIVKSLQEALVIIKPQGAHERVITHLAHPEDEVAVQAMTFLAALVYSGNEKAQQKIGQCSRNRETELFTRMAAILELASTSIKTAPRRIVRTASVVAEAQPEEGVSIVPVTPEAQNGIELTRFQSITIDDKAADTQEQQEEREVQMVSPDMSPVHVHGESQWQLEANIEETKQHVMVVLDLVAWMCDGQKMENQELFREQDSQFNSVNIVSQIALLLQVLAEPLSDSNIPIARKAIQALIELCAGNFANQQAVFKAQIVDTVNSILGRRSAGSGGSGEYKELLELKSSALELLNVLLEETSNQSYDLLQGISQDISTDTILEAMLALWEIREKCETNEVREDVQKGMFDAFHILKKIADNLKQPVEKYVDFDEQVETKTEKAEKLKQMWQDIEKWSRSIEVVYQTEEQKPILTRVYFPYNPKDQISEETKDFIGGKIKRSSPEDKVKDLLEWMKGIYDNMQHKKKVHSTIWLSWTCFLSTPRHFALVLLTLLLNLLTIISFKILTNEEDMRVDDHNSSVFTVTRRFLDVPTGYYPVLYVFGSLHLILSIWMLIEYFVNAKPNLSFQVPFLNGLLWDFKKWVDNTSWLSRLSEMKKIKAIERPKDQECFDVYFIGFGPIYRILFVCFSILSLIFSGYWYCGCLLYVFLKIVVLEQVLTALRRSALQLLIVFLLGLCITFIYAVVSFAFFHAYFDPEDGLFCETLSQCFATVTREGLLDTLGTAIPLKATGQDSVSFTVYGWRVFFDLSFFLIITTIGLNIVVAILVDTFSELREQRDAINEDKKNLCFICGIDNDEFERKAAGFQKHITYDQNMWNYVYFYIHLQKVERCDHNALEKYVYDQIMKKSIQFFPLRKAKVLVGQEKGEENASSTKNGGTSEPGGRKDGDDSKSGK